MADTLMAGTTVQPAAPAAAEPTRGRVPDPQPSPLPDPEPVPRPEPVPQPPSVVAR